jgi:hypothetical protein
LITGDSAGVGHFLQYSNDSYAETLTPQLGAATLDGINVATDGALWTGSGGTLILRQPPSYSSVAWQSPVVGNGFGRFVATEIRNGQNRVFSSARHAVMGFTYGLPDPPILTAAVSRKNHGIRGAFDVALPLTGSLGIECRSGGSDGIHDLVLTFNTAVVSGSASVTSGSGVVEGEPIFSGNQMSITLAGVANAQRVTVTLTDIAGVDGPPLASASFTFGVLEGDVNGSQGVNASDIGFVKSRAGQATNATKFRCDANSSGDINATDIGLAKARSGTVLP